MDCAKKYCDKPMCVVLGLLDYIVSICFMCTTTLYILFSAEGGGCGLRGTVYYV